MRGFINHCRQHPKLSALFLILISWNGCQQTSRKDTDCFRKEQLLEDLGYLKTQFVKCHPGLYWYSSPSEFEEACAAVENLILDGMTEIEFLRAVAKLNNTIGCAHSDIRPSQAFDTFWKDSVLLIPINIRKVGSEYVVWQNLSETDKLSQGTIILSINGVPIHRIVEQLLPYIPSDGKNQTRKYSALRKGFYRYYSYFINSEETTFTVEYLDENGQSTSVMLQGISKSLFDKKRKLIEGLETHARTQPISLQLFDSLSTAVLTIRTFRNDLMEQEGIQFHDFIKNSFEQIQDDKIQNLIIDLRDNGGGYSEYAAVLYSYLTDTAFEYCKNQVLTSDTLIHDIEYDIPATFEGFPDGIVFENGQFKWKKHSVLGWRQPAENPFLGNVYFLINGGCSSTTSELASLARSHSLGYFIGEEVGGAFAGNSGGVLGWIELPNTKIRARIAMVKYEITNGQSNFAKGVIPDLEATYSLEDLKTEKDLEFELALKKIEQQNQ